MSPSPLLLFVLLDLAACAPIARQDAPADAAPPAASTGGAASPAMPETPPMPPEAIATCDAAKAQGFVGRKADEGTVQAAMAASGAKTVRVLRPGMMVTMDYRGDRLNLQLDGKGLIASARCG
ncbi:MAG: I78 family peptidase inhibitor [Lysobacteraceae bacterium]